MIHLMPDTDIKAAMRARPARRAGRRMALALLAILVAAPVAGAEGRRFSTSNGAVVRLDSVAKMECDDLSAKLDEIDATGYRGQSPTPNDPADQPLFIYEHKVARALYTRCARDITGSEVSGVLRRGFRN
jgi:hypothetical protein